MRTFALVPAVAGLLAMVSAAVTKESVEIVGTFPPENKFGIVFNGEPNKMLLKITNLAKDPLEVVTIKSVDSEFREIGGKERLLRKNKPTPLKGSIAGGSEPAIVPYVFSSELREGNVKLQIWVDWTTPEGLKERTVAYDGTVTISEPPARWFDPQLLILYAILIGGLGYGGLAAYKATLGASKKGRPGKVRLPTGTELKPQLVSTPGGGKYEAEWIPKSHMKKGSGADSGGETSGAEGKTRRRKR